MDGYVRLGLGINHPHSTHLVSIYNFMLISNGLPGVLQAVPSEGFFWSPSKPEVGIFGELASSL